MSRLVSVLALGLTLAFSSAALLAASPAAYAQEIETVVVSGSRITADGFTAPTPTTVMTMEDIQATAQPAIYDAVAQLPSLQGSVGLSGSPNNGSSNGLNGLSSFSMRGLGAIRTLTLIDGQRVVPGNINGTVDVALMPQLLIERVDVVTGGASASWGSDAVGGVVNFVTDKKYSGMKGQIQGGMSNYDDDYSTLIQLAAGTELFGGRGHLTVATEFYNNSGVQGPYAPSKTNTNGRCCNYNNGLLSYPVTATPAGVPQITPSLNVQNTSNAQYGLITGVPAGSGAAATALVGTAFNAAGQPIPFLRGTNCVGTNCIGGELALGGYSDTIEDPTTRGNFYTRLSYDLSTNVQVYGTVNYGTMMASNNTGDEGRTGFTVRCGNYSGGTQALPTGSSAGTTTALLAGANPYLPASLQQACLNGKATSFTMALGNESTIRFPSQFHINRTQRRYVAGATGNFDLFGTEWEFDTYFQHGENGTSIRFSNMPLTNRLLAAMDAAPGANGTVVCRAAAARAAGCVPINIFGSQPVSASEREYIAPAANAYVTNHNRQEAASIAFNGLPFKTWAGDVALAVGAEYREEAYEALAPAYGNGVSALSPLNTDYPNDPLLNLVAGDNFRTGNFHNGSGNYHVQEAFVEFAIPVLDTPDWGKADLSLAGRGTYYSTSGYVNTWKVGVSWETPVDGVRLRAVQSRDVRAPNLSELFSPPQSTLQSVTNRLLPTTAPAVPVFNKALGNPNLNPETAQTTEIGVVYSPSYLPGFNLSVDYFRVSVKGMINKLTNQQQVDLCQQQGNLDYCSTFDLNVPAPGTNFVNLIPFNLASTKIEGFDIEASYRFDLEDWGVPGNFTFRGLASNMGTYVTASGVLGQPIRQSAGSTANLTSNNTAALVSHWKVRLSQRWSYGDFDFNLNERYFSAGKINAYGIECQTGCPVPTAQNPTYSNNTTPDYLFIDVGASYKITDGVQVYGQINNIADQMNKERSGGASDPIGRLYRVGVRFNT